MNDIPVSYTVLISRKAIQCTKTLSNLVSAISFSYGLLAGFLWNNFYTYTTCKWNEQATNISMYTFELGYVYIILDSY